MITKDDLERLYLREGKSQQQVARLFKCSVNKIAYWMHRYQIQRRSISQAIYLKNNPDGDPFRFVPPRSVEDIKLFGLGLGLYWGEGTKACKHAVRLGNTDPRLILTFMNFLIRIFSVKKCDFRFGLQIFHDIDTNSAVRYWCHQLSITKDQFMKPTVSPSQSTGTYKRKCENGVLTLYYHNKKLRDLLVGLVLN